MDIIKTITDWPVIVQGALGSALFWVILETGQRLLKQATSRFSSDQMAANYFALAAHEAEGKFGEKARFMCLYAALHYCSKAAIVIVLSLVLGQVFGIFATVGYLLAVFFLFRALAFVPHTASWGTTVQRESKFKDVVTAIRSDKSTPPRDTNKVSESNPPVPSIKRET
ncbi:hypothetical protein RAE19_05235 [Rhodoferax sp. TBRC 17660]|uniref:MAPEG family protein n=1 Tax=Rhodoferax potami TaxID=3068338 RepID=A0ABU3KK33_9BURK|nr:hypothetical protein [Rhodoferax sp. TBRC 17660]MDT7518141.1 hypothetical protein [Rhodoferax sp. TBRC 17660]